MVTEQIQRRTLLDNKFRALVDHVYYQPPNNTQMEYPCIVYKRDRSKTTFADNLPYVNAKGYLVTVMDKDPDSSIPDQVEALPYCSFDRHFTAGDLNHDVFILFF